MTESSDEDLIFETLWKRALEAWDDDKAHAALIDYALRAEKLSDAAGRYRAITEDPEKGPRAQKKLDAIVVAATQMLMSMKTPPRMKTPWQITVTAGILCFVAVAFLYYAFFRR